MPVRLCLRPPVGKWGGSVKEANTEFMYGIDWEPGESICRWLTMMHLSASGNGDNSLAELLLLAGWLTDALQFRSQQTTYCYLTRYQIVFRACLSCSCYH